MLFVDFSSAFNTIIPQHLISKLALLGFNTTFCNWMLDSDRLPSVHVGKSISSVITLSTGSPQNCILSPLLFTLVTYDCAARSPTNHIIQYVDDTTVVGLIQNEHNQA